MKKFLFLGLFLWACGNDNGGTSGDAGTNPDQDSGMDGCAVEDNFTSLYNGLLSKPRCNLAGCHAGADPRGMLDFGTSQQAAYDALVMGDTANTTAKTQFPKRITPGAPTTSFLYEKVVTATVPDGRMPPGPMLPDCEIQAIRSWIQAGALNN